MSVRRCSAAIQGKSRKDTLCNYAEPPTHFLASGFCFQGAADPPPFPPPQPFDSPALPLPLPLPQPSDSLRGVCLGVDDGGGVILSLLPQQPNWYLIPTRSVASSRVDINV